MRSFRETPALGIAAVAGLVAVVTAYPAGREVLLQGFGRQTTATITARHDSIRYGRRSWSRRPVTVIDYKFIDDAGRVRKDWAELPAAGVPGNTVPVVYAPWAGGPSRPVAKSAWGYVIAFAIAAAVTAVAGVVFVRWFSADERGRDRRRQAWVEERF